MTVFFAYTFVSGRLVTKQYTKKAILSGGEGGGEGERAALHCTALHCTDIQNRSVASPVTNTEIVFTAWPLTR